MATVRLRGIGDFVPGGFPEPHNPIAMIRANWDPHGMSGFGDFVPASFPEPHNPISGMGDCGGCGSGCGCESCGGMGDIQAPAWAANMPAFLQGSAIGVPKVYLAGGAIAIVGLAIAFSGGGRRRR